MSTQSLNPKMHSGSKVPLRPLFAGAQPAAAARVRAVRVKVLVFVPANYYDVSRLTT
jgi:hypothetical protein